MREIEIVDGRARGRIRRNDAPAIVRSADAVIRVARAVDGGKSGMSFHRDLFFCMYRITPLLTPAFDKAISPSGDVSKLTESAPSMASLMFASLRPAFFMSMTL